MHFRSLFLACTAALLFAGNSQAANYSGLTVSHSYSGALGSYSDSTSGYSDADQEYGILVLPPSKGLSVQGSYSLGNQGPDTLLSFTATSMTGGAINETVDISFTTTIQFTLDQAISATAFRNEMGYNSGPFIGTYTMTVNGNAVPFYELHSVNLLQGLNTIVFTGSLTSLSLTHELNETGGGAIWFNAAPAPVPEPASWALITFGAGAAFVAARRKASKARA